MRKTLFLILFAVLAIGAVFGQTQPAAQTIPYAQDFATLLHTDTAYPAGIQGWQVPASPGSVFKTDAPSADRVLIANSTAAINSANVHNYNGKIGFLNNGTIDHSIVLALNTVGKQNVRVAYDIMTIRNPQDASNSRINEVTLQYRIGTTGVFTTLTGIEYQNIAVNQTTGTEPQNLQAKAIVLPSACDNQDVVQVRWISRQISGAGGRPSFAVDNLNVTESAVVTPTINISGVLNPFSTTTGTPSTPQSYTVTGSNLTGDITIITPTGFEWAITADATTWYQSFALASSWNAPIYVRMTGANQGTFNGIITHTSPGATLVEVSVSGQVDDPVPTILPVGTLSAFNTIVGTPSTAQQYALTGAFLTTNIVVAAPAGFELSTDGTTYTSGLSLAPAFNGQIHVRLIGTTVGTYTGNITHNSTGAPEAVVAVSGSVTDPSVPTTFLEENFPYTAGTTLVSNGWVAHSGAGTNSPIVADAGLTYPGYPAASGLAGKTINTGEDVHKNFPSPQTMGTIYNSFLINVTSATETGDYIYHYATNVSNTSDFKAKLFVGRDSANNVRFGLTKAVSSGTPPIVWTGYTYSLNTTYLVVLKYEFVSGTANDIVTAWINPTIGATEPAAQLSAVTTEADIGTLGIGAVGIRQSNAALAAIFDGIRVTNNWALLWDGTPPPPPEITVTGELTPFVSTVNTPSTVIQSYTLTGSNLTTNLVAQAPSGFQLSTTGTDGWADMLTLASNYNGLIYVRMFTTAANTYEGDIHHTSTGADPVDLHVSGESFNPAVIWNITQNLQQFSQEAGTPSENQSYTLSATNATANIGITVEAPFELSTTGTSNWLSTLDLAPAFNGTIYVRMNSATAASFNSTIVHSTTDASNYDIEVSGTATAPPGNYATDLFFSEYTEAATGNNKLLEIFNGTGLPVDLTPYSVKLASNGGAWGNTLLMTGTLTNNDVYVIANASSTPELLALADVTSNVTFYNGDDAVGLFKNDVLIDIIGVQGVDPGSAWPVAGVSNGTVDHTLIRKPTIIVGNTDFTTGAGTNVDDSEWIVMAWNDNTNLGIHTFTPGAQMVATPVFTPAGGVYDTSQSVTISSATTDASIYYTTDGTDPTELSTPYTVAFSVGTTTTLKAKAYKTGFAPSAVASAIYYFPTNVSNIAALRAQATGTTAYRLTGEAVLTFQQSTTRHPKYIQDATAAIVIDDPSAIISTTYNLYDGITGITGTLADYNGLLQFTPVADPGAATSTGNVVVPEVRTLTSLTSADQGKLIKVMNVNIDAALGNFPSYAANINATDPTATRILRTFAGTDYNGTPIPTVATDIVCLVGQYLTDMQISPRFLSDMTPSTTGTLDTPVVTISRSGTNVTLNWNAITGANGGYRIEADTNPYGSFAETYTVATGVLTWSQASAEKKFYRVIALP